MLQSLVLLFALGSVGWAALIAAYSMDVPTETVAAWTVPVAIVVSAVVSAFATYTAIRLMSKKRP
jgi:hypothetical protein